MRIGSLVVAIVLAGTPAFAQTLAPARTVSAADFARTMADTTLIDVREPAEWAQTGVPAGAQRISLSRADFVSAVLAQVDGDKTKPVALICRSGSRSTRAADQLVAAGFTSVTNIGDGMIGRDGVGKGWLAAQLPLSRVETGE